MRRFAILFAALPLAASDDAGKVVERLLAANEANAGKANQYTYVEQADYFVFDKGQPKKDRSETHEVIFVEGETYKKLVARNDRPLDGKEQAKEDKRLKETAEERRKHRRQGLLQKSVSFGGDKDLLTLFDARLLPDEEVRGHKTWVLLCTPKAGRAAANTHERQVMSFERKHWLEQDGANVVKEVFTVVGPHTMFTPGSTVCWEYEKINDAWLVVSGAVDGHLQFAQVIKPAVRTEYRNSKFQKFDVQSTITLDPGNEYTTAL